MHVTNEEHSHCGGCGGSLFTEISVQYGGTGEKADDLYSQGFGG